MAIICQNMKIKYKDKDYSISFTRCIAMLFIVLCHLLQYYNIELCWWFNVGVQIFFIISGWLYFNKEFNSIKSVIKFYFKNAIKILVDYYIYISVLFVIFIAINRVPEGMINLFNLSGTIPGLGHLWFIKYILICYLLVPFFEKIIDFCSKKQMNYISAILIPVFIALICKQFNIIGAWINCFYFGLLLHSLEDYKYYKYLTKSVYITAILLNSIQIYLQYILKLDLINIKNGHYLCEYAHVFLGLLCFYFLKNLYVNYINKNKLNKFLNATDKYSYDIYLTHHIFILGSYSLFNNSNNFYLNLILLIAAIILSTYILNFISINIKTLMYKTLLKPTQLQRE